MLKPIILSSHLALRFYKHHGWTKELLESYLLRGEVLDVWADQEPRDYWFLNHTKSSALDVDRLMKDLSPKVFDWSDNELEGEEALFYLKSMNW